MCEAQAENCRKIGIPEEIVVDKLIQSVANIANAVTDNAHADLINSISDFAQSILAGKLSNAGIEENLLISDLLAKVKGVTDNFVESEVIDEVVAQLSKLYSGALVSEIGNKTLALKLDDIIERVKAIALVVIEDETTKAITEVMIPGEYSTFQLNRPAPPNSRGPKK